FSAFAEAAPARRNDGVKSALNSAQKMSGWPSAANTRLPCRMNRTHSRLASVQAASQGRGRTAASGAVDAAAGEGFGLGRTVVDIGRMRRDIASLAVLLQLVTAALRFGGRLFNFQSMACAVDEDVFERGFAECDRFDLAGKCFDQL